MIICMRKKLEINCCTGVLREIVEALQGKKIKLLRILCLMRVAFLSQYMYGMFIWNKNLYESNDITSVDILAL